MKKIRFLSFGHWSTSPYSQVRSESQHLGACRRPRPTAIQAADTLLLTVPNQLGVENNAHAIESILTFVAPDLGWR